MDSTFTGNLLDTLGLGLWMLGMGFRSFAFHMTILEEAWSPLPEMFEKYRILQGRLEVYEARMAKLRIILGTLSVCWDKSDPTYHAIIRASQHMIRRLEEGVSSLRILEMDEECMYPTKEIQPGLAWHAWNKEWQQKLRELETSVCQITLKLQCMIEEKPDMRIPGRHINEDHTSVSEWTERHDLLFPRAFTNASPDTESECSGMELSIEDQSSMHQDGYLDDKEMAEEEAIVEILQENSSSDGWDDVD
ncbi:MAG: hypothetical protein DHS80DRAFT_31284 [Piptocephalis tieghemiana]|nr:MAG: hypothetical protein DHS80DRAFT_31284 [Piptocephalis tieghemiana]